MTRLISVIGSPGAGKSTLCRTLAERYTATGVAVDHFAEEHILTRAAFASVAEEFADGSGVVRPETLVAATRDHVRQARADGVEVSITDALVPFIPSLRAWGHDEEEITEIVRDLERAVDATEVIIVHLIDDPSATLRRAAEREGPGWLDWYLGKLRSAAGTAHVVDLDTAAEHLRQEAALTRRVLARSDWTVIEIEVAGHDPDELAKTTFTRLARV
jgi:hypothetical protein